MGPRTVLSAIALRFSATLAAMHSPCGLEQGLVCPCHTGATPHRMMQSVSP